jgi:hypothetical protein
VFRVNNVTLVLERLPGCDPTSCIGTLELSSETLSDDGVNFMTFLGIAPRTFDGMFEVTRINLQGQPIQNNPKGLWDDLFAKNDNNEGVTVNLRKTLYNCVPPYRECLQSSCPDSCTWFQCFDQFPRITFEMSTMIARTDVCVHVNDCGYEEHTCSVWRNADGMASLGGECRDYCLEFDISGKGITDLPVIPNGLVDGIDSLNILKIDDEIVLKPTRMFSTRNLMGRRLFVLKQNNQSWAFAGKAWFTVPHNHKTIDMTQFVQ